MQVDEPALVKGPGNSCRVTGEKADWETGVGPDRSSLGSVQFYQCRKKQGCQQRRMIVEKVLLEIQGKTK